MVEHCSCSRVPITKEPLTFQSSRSFLPTTFLKVSVPLPQRVYKLGMIQHLADRYQDGRCIKINKSKEVPLMFTCENLNSGHKYTHPWLLPLICNCCPSPVHWILICVVRYTLLYLHRCLFK